MIEVKALRKSFLSGDVETHVLKGIDFRAETGDFVAIMGRSGAGKSTLMYQMSLLDYPTSGDVVIDGKNASNMNEAARVAFRLRNFGYVFQDYALLPELSALENVALPLFMQGKTKTQAYKESKKALERVGLGSRLYNLPSQLSGGEQQRVSIARSVAHEPDVLFADEPTANLDNESSKIVLEIFEELNHSGQTIIMVTHEEEFAQHADRIIFIDDGQILREAKGIKHRKHRHAHT